MKKPGVSLIVICAITTVPLGFSFGMIGTPWWVDILILAGIWMFFPNWISIIGSMAIWIIGIVVLASGTQDVYAIIYYVVSVIYLGWILILCWKKTRPIPSVPIEHGFIDSWHPIEDFKITFYRMPPFQFSGDVLCAYRFGDGEQDSRKTSSVADLVVILKSGKTMYCFNLCSKELSPDKNGMFHDEFEIENSITELSVSFRWGGQKFVKKFDLDRTPENYITGGLVG